MRDSEFGYLLRCIGSFLSCMLTDDSQRGHAVCEILSLVYSKGCYSLMKTFSLIIVREEVLEFARLRVWLLAMLHWKFSLMHAH